MNAPEVIDAGLLRRFPLPGLDPGTDKNNRGRVLVAGASATSAGAVTLSGLAAFRAGAGKVLLAVPQPLAMLMAVGFPEAGVHGFSGTMDADPDPRAAASEIAVLAAKVDAALIGPGFTNESSAQELTKRLLAEVEGPAFVIDALSLTGLWNQQELLRRHRGRLVITPHAGEMARLSGASKDEVCADPLGFAAEAAQRLDCVVVLKGSTTVIAQPQGAAFIHQAALAALATSGSGDVLAGVLAGLLARGMPPLPAAAWAVFLHAQAGRILCERFGPVGLLARELPAEIPALMRGLDS
jgi:ADP-dependent NAD(P)H-hydrate dehydratase